MRTSPWRRCCSSRSSGYTVKTTKIDEYAQFPALANGQSSATLEVWPSGHAKDYKKYIAAVTTASWTAGSSA